MSVDKFDLDKDPINILKKFISDNQQPVVEATLELLASE